MSNKIRAAIVGGSGFVGRELIRLLLSHPDVEIASVSSREYEGKPIHVAHPGFAGLCNLNFSKFEASKLDVDVVFLALSHGESMDAVKSISTNPKFINGTLKIVDLGADFRLPLEKFEATYKLKHSCPELLSLAVYGTPETCPDKIAKARIIANPGCFAHCTYLSLAPLVASGHAESEIQVAAVTGSSGSGVKAQEKTHHPDRNESMGAYQVLTHRHIPEIESALSLLTGAASQPKLSFVPISGPFTRGIFATSFVKLKDSNLDLDSVFASFAEGKPFLRLRAETPKLLDVRGSNFADFAVTKQSNTAVVIGAIDNLVKGAAGNAIQCMNLMFNLPQTSGLFTSPIFP